MNKDLITGAVAFSLLTFGAMTVQAEDLSYTFIEGGYNKVDEEADPKGFSVKGSYGITNNIYLAGDYLSVSGKPKDAADIDTTKYSAAVGYHQKIARGTDLYGQVGYTKAKGETKAEGQKITKTVSGAAIGVGVRSRLNDLFEVQAEVSHFNSDTDLNLKGMYHINNAFSVGAGVEGIDNDDKMYTVFARVQSF